MDSIFSARFTVNSSTTIDPVTYDVVAGIYDGTGMYSGLDVQVNDIVILDTFASISNPNTITRYRVTQINSANVSTVDVRVVFDDTGTVVDPSEVTGTIGFIGRRSSNLYFVFKAAPTLHGIPDYLTQYADNLHEFEIIDRISINLQNTLYVAKNGTDTRTDLSKYSINHPFLTVQAAVNAAVAGETVEVYPGVYSESVAGKDLVDIYLHDGAIIERSTAGQAVEGGVFSDAGAAISCRITGNGIIRWIDTGATAPIHAVWVQNSSSNIKVTCQTSTSDGSSLDSTVKVSGTVDVVGSITATGVGVIGENCTLDVQGRITSTGKNVICGSDANITVFDSRLNGDGVVLNGTNGTLSVYGCYLTNTVGGSTVLFDGDDKTFFAHATVFRPDASKTAAVEWISGTGGIVKMARCSGTKAPSDSSNVSVSALDYLEVNSL